MKLISNQYVRLGISYEGYEGTSRRGLRRICIHLRIKLGSYELEASTSSLQPWSHFRVHKHEFTTHIVWGQFSVQFGQPGLVPVDVCGHCGTEVTGTPAGDDDYLTYCPGCEAIEGPVDTITLEQYEALNA